MRVCADMCMHSIKTDRGATKIVCNYRPKGNEYQTRHCNLQLHSTSQHKSVCIYVFTRSKYTINNSDIPDIAAIHLFIRQQE